MHEHLKTVGGTGPTDYCLNFWWSMVAMYIVVWVWLYMTLDWKAVFALGVVTGVIGGYGHNWIHQPKYRLYAYIGLDMIGLSSESWYREHVL